MAAPAKDARVVEIENSKTIADSVGDMTASESQNDNAPDRMLDTCRRILNETRRYRSFTALSHSAAETLKAMEQVTGKTRR